MPPDPERVRHIAGRAFNTAIETLATIEILEAGNRPEVRAALEGLPVPAATMIRTALFARVSLNTVREFDPIRSSGDEHLAVVFKKHLPHAETRQAVAMRGSAQALQEACHLWGAAEKDARLEQLRQHRNKEIAHLSAWNSSLQKSLIKDLFGFAQRTAEVCERLAFATGVCTVELEHHVNEHRKSAVAFWDLCRGVRPEPDEP